MKETTARGPRARRVLLLPTLALALGVGALEAPALRAAPITLGETATLHSEILGEERELLVYLPNGYEQGDQRYPVLYVLDGRPSFKLTAGIVHGLAESGDIPRLVMVAVANTDRWRDLTPTPGPESATTGGGDAFLEFIEKELVPWVEGRYRTTSHRAFLGHSLGGLMAVHALVERPDLFDGLIALSPTLGWDDSDVVDRAAELFARSQKLERHLYLALADEPNDRPPYLRFVELLDRSAPPGLEWRDERLPTASHLSVRVAATLGGLQAVYDGWRPPTEVLLALTAGEREEHFARVDRRLGTDRGLPVDQLVDAAFFVSENEPERALALLSEAEAADPSHAFAIWARGRIEESRGRPQVALGAYRRAVTISRQQGDQDGHLSFYEESTARLEAEVSP